LALLDQMREMGVTPDARYGLCYVFQQRSLIARKKVSRMRKKGSGSMLRRFSNQMLEKGVTPDVNTYSSAGRLVVTVLVRT
jgi:hypothetical protein